MDIKNSISIDINGNLYINDYWVFINKDDDIDFLKINNLTFNIPEVNEGKTKKLSNQLLKAKMIEDEIDTILNGGDGNNFIDEEDQNNVQFYINNPEAKYVNYYDINNDDYNDSYYQLFGEYKLANNNFENANYEVFFIDSKLKTPIFYSQIVNDNPFYRISVFTNNTIQLNLIGTKIKTFNLSIENDNINVKLINTKFMN